MTPQKSEQRGSWFYLKKQLANMQEWTAQSQSSASTSQVLRTWHLRCKVISGLWKQRSGQGIGVFQCFDFSTFHSNLILSCVEEQQPINYWKFTPDLTCLPARRVDGPFRKKDWKRIKTIEQELQLLDKELGGEVGSEPT